MDSFAPVGRWRTRGPSLAPGGAATVGLHRSKAMERSARSVIVYRSPFFCCSVPAHLGLAGSGWFRTEEAVGLFRRGLLGVLRDGVGLSGHNGSPHSDWGLVVTWLFFRQRVSGPASLVLQVLVGDIVDRGGPRARLPLRRRVGSRCEPDHERPRPGCGVGESSSQFVVFFCFADTPGGARWIVVASRKSRLPSSRINGAIMLLPVFESVFEYRFECHAGRGQAGASVTSSDEFAKKIWFTSGTG